VANPDSEISSSGRVAYTMQHCTVLLDMTSESGFATAAISKANR